MRLLRYAATTATTLAIATGGVAGIVGASSVSNSGPDGHVTIHASNHQKTENNNNTTAGNSNSQVADTGNVKVHENTTGGDAASGGAMNENSLDATVTNDNTGSCGCLGGSGGLGDGMNVDNSGPDGKIKIDLTNKVKVTNNNNTNISNSNSQVATTGDVKVSDNTTAGNATSGDASNSNSTTITVSNSN